jgi:hypothetical protein
VDEPARESRESGGALAPVKIAAGTWSAVALTGMLPAISGDPPDLRVRLPRGEDVPSIPRREAAIGLRSRRPTEMASLDGQSGAGSSRSSRRRAPPGAPRWPFLLPGVWPAGRTRDRRADIAHIRIQRRALHLVAILDRATRRGLRAILSHAQTGSAARISRMVDRR